MASPIREGLTAQEVADGLGVTKQTVYNWLRVEDLPCKDTPRGKIIKLRDLVDWHVKRVEREPVKPVKSPLPEEPIGPPETYDAALARKTRADADLQELRLAKARGEVVAVADLERILAAANKALQTQMLAMPSNLADRVLGMDEVSQIRAVITAEVHAVLTNVASIDAVREASASAEVAQ